MTVFLLSLGGMPPLGGFVAKWYVFAAAMKAGYVWLAVVGVLTSVASVFFYLRIVVMMYMTPSASPVRVPAIRGVAGASLVTSAVIVFYLGILPSRVLGWAAHSIRIIFLRCRARRDGLLSAVVSASGSCEVPMRSVTSGG